MPDPRVVYDNPEEYWSWLTCSNDSDLEGQFFDRKELPGSNDGITKGELDSFRRENITKCLSAFANANTCGGLLVIGVARNGAVKGIGRLSEGQRNKLTNIGDLLRNQAAQVKEYDCDNEQGHPDKICLAYIPFSQHGICETPESIPRAWFRQGSQSILLDHHRRDKLLRERKIRDFEQTYCCDYRPEDVDTALLDEFRRVFLADATYNYSNEEVLDKAGALVSDGNGYAFTNAGLLFFAANPQRCLPSSTVRLLQFEALVAERATRGLPTVDREFSGPLPTQIRDIRKFLQQSIFFKTYQRRNPAGGFVEEPEYPYLAVDESIVNAIAHRDYGMTVPILVEKYRDALMIHNPGRVVQQELDVPEQFSLDSLVLNSVPRNPMLIGWLRRMRDERGAAFVRALGEGTKVMRDEMRNLSLLAPQFHTGIAGTTVTLFSDAPKREALSRSSAVIATTEHANLYPLYAVPEAATPTGARYIERKSFANALESSLRANGWYVHSNIHGRIIAHLRGAEIKLPETVRVRNVIRLFPAYEFQLRSYMGRDYLCVDYRLEVRSMRSVQNLIASVALEELVGRKGLARWNGASHPCKIASVDGEWVRVYLLRYEQEQVLPPKDVIVDILINQIRALLTSDGIGFDLDRAIKEHSLSLQPNSARIRDEKVAAVISQVSATVFPMSVSGLRVSLDEEPVALLRGQPAAGQLEVRDLPEPTVEFSRHQETDDIRDGITQYGSYDSDARAIELIPICESGLRDSMAKLIDRLKVGKFKYKGSERTFHSRFSYGSIIETKSASEIPGECGRLLREHPEWTRGDALDRLFLVCTPEAGYAIDDESAPYYQAKRVLLEGGVACQMVDLPTLRDPDFKDLNLALNVTAKCGVTPWVLPDAVVDADFFVGLSYTQSQKRRDERLMGYANVFNQYGRWMFYSGNTEPFPYEQRTQYFGSLVGSTLERLSLSDTPSIHFHYSAKFSREDREAILEAARKIRPRGTYSFVWVNTHHNVRFYDSQAETNGSLGRGSYVVTSPNQIYLSTTGNNPYRKVLGTPRVLEVNVWREGPNGKEFCDLKTLAIQILSLTKLNWASTDSLCAEPITTKYAHDIAYLTAAFLRQGKQFSLHSRLEKTPWFI